jgi:hypothetical protein
MKQKSKTLQRIARITGNEVVYPTDFVLVKEFIHIVDKLEERIKKLEGICLLKD